METNRGRGRPTKPDDERRSELIQVRVTRDELETLTEAADGKLSTWAREALLRAAKRRLK
jgi:hypothetical protein